MSIISVAFRFAGGVDRPALHSADILAVAGPSWSRHQNAGANRAPFARTKRRAFLLKRAMLLNWQGRSCKLGPHGPLKEPTGTQKLIAETASSAVLLGSAAQGTGCQIQDAQGRRTADRIALALVAPRRPQKLHIVEALNAFGRDRQVEAVAKSNDGADDGL